MTEARRELAQTTKDSGHRMDVGLLAFILWFFTLATAPFGILIPLVAVDGPLAARLIVPIIYGVIWLAIVRRFTIAISQDQSELGKLGLKLVGNLLSGIVILLTLWIGDPDNLACLVSLFFLTFTVPPYALMIVMVLFARRRITWSLWSSSLLAICGYVKVIYEATDGFNLR